jgi:hypothetical protein
VALVHAIITSYVKFTQILMDSFENKDPEIHFRELAQLRQTCTIEAYITDFSEAGIYADRYSSTKLGDFIHGVYT